jgi:UDP-N-acetylglucosamine 2-epimerase (non-hydrolysing)
LRSVGVVTVGRSDYGIYLSVLRRIRDETGLELRVMASGMHLSQDFGLTVRDIEADGFEVTDRVDMLEPSDSPEAIAKSIGRGITGFAEAFARDQPDMLLTLGDRFEMYAATVAALPFRLPVAHISGGEVTQGAIDDAMRHSMTKLSHLHFVSTREYAERVVQMGEEDWRVMVTGSPSLDSMRETDLLTRDGLSRTLKAPLPHTFLLVTYHPVTLEFDQTAWQVGELLAGLNEVAMPVLFTAPNSDTGGRTIRRMVDAACEGRDDWQVVENLGSQAYFSALSLAIAMVGNSSSGIVEAGMFELPVVNVGTRQTGRLRSQNIIDVGYTTADVSAGVRKAMSAEFAADLVGMISPFGDGHASERIVSRLLSVPLDADLLVKKFNDHPAPWEEQEDAPAAVGSRQASC